MRSTTQTATLGELIAQTERRLHAAHLSYGHGTLNARDEAAWLVSYAVGINPNQLNGSLQRAPGKRERGRVDRLVRQRIESRKPLAYLLGEAWLCGFRFKVDQRVIVPRSLIAAPLLETFSPWISRPRSVGRVLDLCTGSGCLAILAALAFPKAHVDALDISRHALALARKNVETYGLSRRISLIQSDLYQSLPPQKYDLIITNPPYVDALAMKRLPQEYRREPSLALSGGKDGLDLVDRILKDGKGFLKHRGFMVIEIGHNLAAFESRYPDMEATWLESGQESDAIVWLESRQIQYLNNGR